MHRFGLSSRTLPGLHNEVLERATRIAEHYAESTGIQVKVLTELTPPDQLCSLCTELGNQASYNSCFELHQYNARQSERFGGSYIYFCNSSLLYWTSPIIHEGVMVGAFTAGPAIIIDAEEIIEEWKHQYPGNDENQLRRDLAQVPQITPKKSSSLAELLLMCAGWVNESSELMLIESKKYQDQQAHISTYIHQLKSQDTPVGQSYPIELEEELYTAITQGKKRQAQEVLNEILGNVFFTSGNNMDLISLRVTELIVMLSRAAIDGGADPEETLSMNFTYLRQVNQFRTLESLSYWLSHVLTNYSDLVFDLQKIKHVDRLERALHYIHTHYAERITLEEAAEYAALSPTYFSKVFKEEIGVNFTRYINQIRVNHAKTLLKTTPCTLIEIAGLVGFEDQSYFSRVFKQELGISPGKYRAKSALWKHYSPEPSS
ncbi:MAG: helix-turn-helix domain-containing protein [Spirochaetota bacterium]